mmetsp:Transcript_2041/g.3038  ORF Transcript_2041/g.3038 Transcript_2041/m.3038 type:complete len:210 (-) Transcript_2041:200-829(-)
MMGLVQKGQDVEICLTHNVIRDIKQRRYAFEWKVRLDTSINPVNSIHLKQFLNVVTILRPKLGRCHDSWEGTGGSHSTCNSHMRCGYMIEQKTLCALTLRSTRGYSNTHVLPRPLKCLLKRNIPKIEFTTLLEILRVDQESLLQPILPHVDKTGEPSNISAFLFTVETKVGTDSGYTDIPQQLIPCFDRAHGSGDTSTRCPTNDLNIIV